MKSIKRLLVLFIIPVALFASFQNRKDVKYRSSFGECPSRAAGRLTLKLVKEFERTQSLREVKKLIIRDDLVSRHFLSSYNISYDPLKEVLNLKFKCPLPLMKAQVYKKGGIDSYEAVLVENGDLYDPTYEVLLRTEKKIKNELPYLAVPVDSMEDGTVKKLALIISEFKPIIKENLSEVIISDKKELTIILSIRGRPSSVFLGSTGWEEKVLKLTKIVDYLTLKKKIPAIINLTNSKKVVVKFSDKF